MTSSTTSRGTRRTTSPILVSSSNTGTTSAFESPRYTSSDPPIEGPPQFAHHAFLLRSGDVRIDGQRQHFGRGAFRHGKIAGTMPQVAKRALEVNWKRI